MQGPFKRLNFFTGFFTTAKDWIDGETYHLEKRKLHARGLHTPGVFYEVDPVLNEWTTLRVTKNSDSSVQVSAGAALDGFGNLIYLHQDTNLSIATTILDNSRDAGVAVVVILFRETKEEVDRETGEYEGFKRMTECPKIMILEDSSDEKSAVRLAKIKLKRDGADLKIEGDPVDIRERASAKGMKELEERLANLSAAVAANRVHHDEETARLGGELSTLGTAVAANHVQHNQDVTRLSAELLALGAAVIADREQHNEDVTRLDEDVLKLDTVVAANFERHNDDVTQLNGALSTTNAVADEDRRQHTQDVARLDGMLLALDAAVVANYAQHNQDVTRLDGQVVDMGQTIAGNRAHHDNQVSMLGGDMDSLHTQSVAHGELHLRSHHTPGVLYGQMKNLRVVAYRDLQVNVQPGVALDALGRLVEVSDEQNLLEVPVPQQRDVVYIVLQADTASGKKSDAFAYPAKLTAQFRKPDAAAGQIELARIPVQPDATQINSPDDPERPGINEIDTTRVVWSGALDNSTQARLQTLEDTLFERLHHYQQATRRRHNQGLHTVGVVPNVGNEMGKELTVVARGGLDVQVQPGMAIDADGNELYVSEPQILRVELPKRLPRVAYITIRAREVGDSGNTNMAYLEEAETPVLKVEYQRPDNLSVIELARIQMLEDIESVGISDQPYGSPPRGNQIDRNHIIRAGAAVSVIPDVLPAAINDRLVQQLGDNRRDFAALNTRFHTPSLDDARHAILNLEMLVRNQSLMPSRLPDTLHMIAMIAADGVHEVAERYPAVAARSAFRELDSASEAYLAAFTKGESLNGLLTSQNQLAEAGRKLAELEFRRPIVRLEQTQYTVTAEGSSATITLRAEVEVAKDLRVEVYRLRKRQ